MPQTTPHTELNNYIVVECQTPPILNNNHIRHVCTPKSWIKCELGGNKVAIVYPSEPESRTAARVRQKQSPDDAWEYYIGIIICERESYEDANYFIKSILLYSKCSPKENDVNISKSEEIVKPNESIKMTIVVPKSNSEKKKKFKVMKTQLVSEAPIGDMPKCESINVQQTLKEDIPLTEAFENTSLNPVGPKTTIDSNKTNTVQQNNSNNPKMLLKTLESKIEDFIENSVLQTLNNYSNNTSHKSISECFDTDLDKELDISSIILNPKVSSAEKRFLFDLKIEHRETLIDIRKVMIYVKALYIKSQENRKILDLIYSKYNDSPPAPAEEQNQETTLNNTETNTDDIQMEYQTEEISDHTSTKESEGENEDQNNQTRTKDNLDTSTKESDQSENQINQKPPPSSKVINNTKKSNNYIRNPKLTLKYPHPGKDLIELGKDTGVYVNAKDLARCENECNNVKAFVRALLEEVFSKNALETCSIYDIKYKNGYINMVRPPLDVHAFNTLITYAMDYGHKVGWKNVDNNILLNILQKSLQEFRLNSMRRKIR